MLELHLNICETKYKQLLIFIEHKTKPDWNTKSLENAIHHDADVSNVHFEQDSGFWI